MTGRSRRRFAGAYRSLSLPQLHSSSSRLLFQANRSSGALSFRRRSSFRPPPRQLSSSSSCRRDSARRRSSRRRATRAVSRCQRVEGDARRFLPRVRLFSSLTPSSTNALLRSRSEPLVIDFSAWFEPYVRRWLAGTDTQTSEWVDRAISKDKVRTSIFSLVSFLPLIVLRPQFEPEETATHSSSVIDLIDSCKAPVNFILELDWPNEFENAKFLTALSRVRLPVPPLLPPVTDRHFSQTIANAIEQYATKLENMFIDEMFPRKADEALDQDVARPSAWLTKAKLVVQGDKKVEPFEFQAAVRISPFHHDGRSLTRLSSQSCIKLNNIQAARRLLDTMYNSLDADKVSRIVEINTPPPAQSADAAPPRFLFTVKMVSAENLSPPTGNSRTKKLDPFLILSDRNGYRVAKTRTLYETNDPRWDETLDITVKDEMWLRATVWHRNLVDHHDHVGCAYVHLDPTKFSDFLARDVWFFLEDQNRQRLNGRLLLRISMEGEKDDIQFYFGRAFRFLKRAEGDMVRTMVDKVRFRSFPPFSLGLTLLPPRPSPDVSLRPPLHLPPEPQAAPPSWPVQPPRSRKGPWQPRQGRQADQHPLP